MVVKKRKNLSNSNDRLGRVKMELDENNTVELDEVENNTVELDEVEKGAVGLDEVEKGAVGLDVVENNTVELDVVEDSTDSKDKGLIGGSSLSHPLFSSYGSFLIEKFSELFSSKELGVFLEESEKSRPVSIRANTLLIKRRELAKLLIGRGVDLSPLEFTEDGLVVYQSNIPLGATPEYLAGYYFVQGASSMLPVLALDIQPGQMVLDGCASPGGKTTHIAQLLQNQGTLYANEINKTRLSSLHNNTQRLNSNTIITHSDILNLNIPPVDRVLIDAPCTGTGTISKDPKVKTTTQKEYENIVELQKKIILNGFDKLKKNGILVYSTCSVLVEENEWVVDYLLKKRKNAKIENIQNNIGKDGITAYRGRHFNKTIKLARRIYPHVHNMDGFFFVRIRKV